MERKAGASAPAFSNPFGKGAAMPGETGGPLPPRGVIGYESHGATNSRSDLHPLPLDGARGERLSG
jgi:hypothetical protein